MKSAFYFNLKAPLVLKIFKFCLEFSVILKNSLIRKIRLFSKFMIPQSGQQTIAIRILSNISKNKGFQAMKFGQLIEHNMRNNSF